MTGNVAGEVRRLHGDFATTLCRSLSHGLRSVGAQRHAGVVRDLPGMTVRIEEDSGVAAPPPLGGLARNRCAGRPGFLDHRVDLGSRAHVVREADAAPAAAVDDSVVLGDLLTPPEGEDEPIGVEEDDLLPVEPGLPAEALVEGTRGIEVANAERQEADPLVQRTTSQI